MKMGHVTVIRGIDCRAIFTGKDEVTGKVVTIEYDAKKSRQEFEEALAETLKERRRKGV